MADSSAPITVHVPPRGYKELEVLAEYAPRLREAIAATADLPLDADAATIGRAIGNKIGVTAAVASHIFSGLTTLRSLADEAGGGANDLLKSIHQSLSFEAPEEWRSAHLSKIQASSALIAGALEEITPDHPLLLKAKARELTYVHQNIYRRSRIITDLRPVFNVAGNHIRAMVLTHVLSVEYYDGVRLQRIEFALDQPDVLALEEACKRAQIKTTATREQFSSCNWTLIIAGDTEQSGDETSPHEIKDES